MDPMIEPHLKVLEELHREITTTVAPLGDVDLNRHVPPLQNTIGILLRHIAGSERYWIGEVVGGVSAHRSRDVEFGADPVEKAALVTELDRVAAMSREVLGRLRGADLLAEVDVKRARGSVRETKAFALLHATQHVAYHLGQLRYLAKLVQAGRS